MGSGILRVIGRFPARCRVFIARRRKGFSFLCAAFFTLHAKGKKSRAAIADAAGISAATMGTAASGGAISAEKATSIAHAMGMKLDNVFFVEKNTKPLSDNENWNEISNHLKNQYV